MSKLFSEFKEITNAQWKEQIIKDLKGASTDILTWHTQNGFDVHPFYTSEDLKTGSKPLFTHSDWDICEHIVVTDEKKANAQALEALKKGASGLAFYIHQKVDTQQLIKGISLDHIYTQFFISNDALHILTDLKNNYGKVNAFDGKVKCFVNIDPVGLFAYYGEWHQSQDNDMAVLKQLVHIPVNASLYQEAGCTQVNELAFALSHCNEYFNYLNESKSLSDKLVHVTFSIGGDFFTEIAKLRAFRKLLSLLQESYQTHFPLHIHCQTSQLNKSEKDAYTNLLRSTTEAMSAVIGGTNSLSIVPYDDSFNEANEFSSRMAINQQHILKDESYLNTVADLASGSYYIEAVSEQLAEKAWEKFKEIEVKGGFIACLNSGYIQGIIAADFRHLSENYKENKAILIGVNKYPNATDSKHTLKRTETNSKGKNIERILPKRLTELF